jgi:hypothetical protein
MHAMVITSVLCTSLSEAAPFEFMPTRIQERVTLRSGQDMDGNLVFVNHRTKSRRQLTIQSQSTNTTGGAKPSSTPTPAPKVPSVANITLAWDPSPEQDVTGYKIYYGTKAGTYPNMLNAGKVSTYQLSNLPTGQTYYFTVTAYNGDGQESLYSNEVSKLLQ